MLVWADRASESLRTLEVTLRNWPESAKLRLVEGAVGEHSPHSFTGVSFFGT